MRVLIAFLVLLNLLLFLVGQMAPSAPVAEQRAPPDIGDLRLWSEVPTKDSQRSGGVRQAPPHGSELAQSTVTPAPVAAVEPRSDGSSDNQVTPSETLEKAASDDGPKVAAAEMPLQSRATDEPLAASVESAQESDSSDVIPAAGAPSSDAREAAAAEGDLLAELAEPPVETAETVPELGVGEQETAEPGVDEAAMRDTICGQLRWFGDIETANGLVAKLGNLGIPAELIDESVEQRNGYWVLIPPQPSRSAALAKRAELRAAGVEDLWLFRKGALSNSISVGLFTGNRRAQKRAEEIRTLGFNVEVRPKLKITGRYVVGYRSDRRRANALHETLSLAASTQNQRVPCP